MARFAGRAFPLGVRRRAFRIFRDAFEHLLTRTLEGMNAGKSADELAAEVTLPSSFAELP